MVVRSKRSVRNDTLTAAQVKILRNVYLAPSNVVQSLKNKKICWTLIVKLADTINNDWSFFQNVNRMGCLRDDKDVSALISFINNDVDKTVIVEWSRLGNLDTALRLWLLNYSPFYVKRFPISKSGNLDCFLRLVNKSSTVGINSEDLLWWFQAGVVSLNYPWVDESKWGQWRRVSVFNVGSKVAALAAAAGLSVDEVIEMTENDTINIENLTFLAELRHGL